MIARYSLPEMAAVFTDEARFGLWLEIELLAVEAWAELGVVPAEHAAACRAARADRRRRLRRRVAEREAVTDHDVAAFVDVVQEAIGPPAGIVDPLRPHLVRRRRHGAVGDARARRRSAARSVGDLVVGHEAPRRRARRGPDRRPHARHARRADDLRHQARPRLPAGRPRPHAPAPGPRGRRGRQALGRRRHLLQHRPGGREPRLRGARAAARPGHPGLARDRHAEYLYACAVARHDRSSRSRPRSATCSAARSARSRSRSAPARRARRRCRTSATRSPPSASSAWPGCCAATSSPASRTSRSGTSGTSPTARSSGSCSPTPACSPTTLRDG